METLANSTRIVDAYPLTALQAGMVFHSEFDRCSPTYRDICSALFGVRFDEDALLSAFGQLVARHAVLRTAFDLATYEEPMQMVYQSARIPLETADLRALSTGAQADLIREQMDASVWPAFDWSRPPLMRASAAILSEDTFRLTMCFHHAILDGWSIASLFTELTQAYARNIGFVNQDLPRQPLAQFRDYVAQEREALASKLTRSFWNNALAGFTYDNQLSRVWTPLEALFRCSLGIESIDIPASDLRNFLDASARFRVPLKSLFLAAHLRVISEMTGESHVATGLVFNARPEYEGSDRVLGLFINTLPLHIRVINETFRAFVQRVFNAERQLLQHRHYPLAAVQRCAGGRQLFDTVFDFHQYHMRTGIDENTGIIVEDIRFYERSNYPLMTSVGRSPSGDEARIVFKYHPDVFSSQQVRTMASLLLKLITDIHCSSKALTVPT